MSYCFYFIFLSTPVTFYQLTQALETHINVPQIRYVIAQMRITEDGFGLLASLFFHSILLNYEDIIMRTFDYSPLLRSTIGFDHFTNLLDSVSRAEQKQPGYPPYNIELVAENQYQITMAVAGFSQDELMLESENNTLTVIGKKAETKNETTYLHRGIAARDFSRKFQLAEHIKVNNAKLENGLLHIDLIRQIPEVMKPRKIEINTDKNK
jgi:molecular chaperone IbpA